MHTLRNDGRAPSGRSRMARVGQALGIAALLGGVSACSDVSTAPAAAPAAATQPAAQPSRATVAIGVKQIQTFVYTGQAITQAFGDGHYVQLGANAVCDPLTTAYGQDSWDKPCAPATAPITFTVTSWRDASGLAKVSFSPDVRFVPGTSDYLYLNQPSPGTAKKATITWCSPIAGGCVDESAADPSVATFVYGGFVTRRIKHFSGYNVVFGFGCDASQDPSCSGDASGT